jgi:hypothetical protein
MDIVEFDKWCGRRQELLRLGLSPDLQFTDAELARLRTGSVPGKEDRKPLKSVEPTRRAATVDPPRRERSRQAVASRISLHESGHCVADTLNEIPVTEAVIEHDPTHGHVRSDWNYANGRAIPPHILAVSVCAGPLAEMILGGATETEAWNPGTPTTGQRRDDLFQLEKLTGGNDAKAKQAKEHAEALVRKHADTIEAVAIALDRHGSLSGEEIQAIIDEHF